MKKTFKREKELDMKKFKLIQQTKHYKSKNSGNKTVTNSPRENLLEVAEEDEAEL